MDLSRWYLENDDLDNALQSLDDGARRLSNPVSLIIRRVELFQNADAYPQALLAIDELPAALRQQPEWLLRRGDILLQAGAEEEAIEAFMDAQYALAMLPEFRRNNPVNRNLKQELAARLAVVTDAQ